MTRICELSEKKCIPCHGGISPFGENEIARLLKELQSQWLVNELGHLYKIYQFSNFVDSMDFANKIAEVAEQEQHHPDLTISYGQCVVEIWTHKINGLSESDFILAAKIDGIIGANPLSA
ncbi:4a-hydroxytetrahydrobiopterin dehydratase [Rickettsiales endosymbiont of Peranema trichophorum]|uniref:4a-hydroxytetrahydrobiopterin dehydratase n=1 Tax=Rickettsiales endosymbiont of Peranema trichophorum TaxID=2486577 RepID=UPI001023B942|nr:4a-hydroxytetrahydrobiopterin dehydratase [Rickettsiales endosymbiont of Peranema trichophorum]RZI47200.1 4a-hydroxytetrahydrobiopterin dehydratase [Rickettsiales endosymbiont of Peranema trichophorum]